MFKLTKSLTFKNYLRYLVPSMLGMALMAVYTFTDTFVVGRKLGAIALGAMGICTPVITISFAFGFLFGMGGGALYAIGIGQNDKINANKVFSTSLLMTICFGIIVAIFGNIFIYQIAYFLGADDVNIVYVIPYLRCIMVYVPGFMLDVFMVAYMKNDGHPNVVMIATVIGTGLNVVLDLLFVFVFDWGMFGAAIATCFGSAVCLSINVLYSLIKNLNTKLVLKNIRPQLMLRIIKNGFSVFILECSSGIVTFVFIMQATKIYGTEGSSIYTIIMNWTLICFNLIMGIAQSVQPLISNSFGANQPNNVKTYRRYALVSAIIAGFLFLIIGYSFTEPLISVFATDDKSLILQTVTCFRLYLPAYAIMGVGITIGIYFQSIESALLSFIIMVLRGIILPIIGAFLLTFVWGETGLWLAVPIAEFATAILAVGCLIIENKKSKKSIHKSETI